MPCEMLVLLPTPTAPWTNAIPRAGVGIPMPNVYLDAATPPTPLPLRAAPV